MSEDVKKDYHYTDYVMAVNNQRYKVDRLRMYENPEDKLFDDNEFKILDVLLNRYKGIQLLMDKLGFKTFKEFYEYVDELIDDDISSGIYSEDNNEENKEV